MGQRISILPGVSRVNVFGTKSAIRIKADPSAMWARGISIDDLTAAIKSGTSYTGAGQFDGSSGTTILRPQGQLETRRAIQQSDRRRRPSGAPVYLRDVATVRDSVQDERVNMRFWVRGYDVPSAPRWSWRSIVKPAPTPWKWPRAFESLLPQISAELPGSVRITPIYDRSLSIVHSVTDVQTTLVIAFVLVVMVIFVFLGRATDTLIPAVALAAVAADHVHRHGLLGYSLDNLSLMALTLAIGFLVDDAIVFLENTVRRMERGERALEAAIQQRQRNQLHDHVDDDIAGGGFYSAGVHVRTGGTNLSRVRDHDRDRDYRFRLGFVDA